MTEELERQVDISNSILERKVLCEVITTTREIKVITELPDVSEKDININIYDNDFIYQCRGSIKELLRSGTFTKWSIW